MSERDTWGRIPVKLVEVDQEFCALEWGELPCGAGPQSNINVYSSVIGDFPWTTDGTVTSFGDEQALSLQTSAAESMTVIPANLPLFPAFIGDRRLYASFSFDPSAGTGDAEVFLVVNGASSGSFSNVSITFTIETENVTQQSVAINDLTFEDSDVFGLRRVHFWVQTSDLGPASTEAYLAYVTFETVAFGTGNFVALRQQVSLDELTDYRPTGADPVLVNESPCFNTLSSCQAPDTYRIDALHDGYSLFFGATPVTYSAAFEGNRNEGLYIEFYLGVTTNPTTDIAKVAIVDIDGILTASLVRTAADQPETRIIFDVDGASIEYPLLGPDFSVYRVAAYVSRAGTLRVRGIEGNVQGSAFSAVPSEIVIYGPPTGVFTLADLLVYDYEAKPITVTTSRSVLVQKGDLTGDALFYAKYNRVTGGVSDSGLVGTPASESEDRVTNDGLSPNTPSLVDLYTVGDVALIEPPLTLRFSERGKSSQLPETLNTIPSLIDASNKPAELQVGGTNENISALGSRDELMATWQDHPYSDIQTDPYLDQRSYDPESQGTFWGKWLARNVYKQGFATRYVSGYELPNGGLERTHVYNYILDKVDGPTNTGKVTGKAFDILQSLRADRAVYPAANTGRLAADLSDTATAGSTFDLQPVGIGDEEYPSSGTFRIRIGGEGFDVTRSGDTFTIGTRGLYGGVESHSEDDVVQEVAQLSDQVHDVAYTIITEALPELAGNIPKDKWDGLADDFLPRIYSADITEPTGVEDLLGELVATAPIYFYADVRTNLIELGVIREPSSAAVPLREGQELIADSVNLKEYPKERIDEVWVYYRIRDAAGDIEDEENYSQRFILVNVDEQVNRGRRSIRRIYTRWLEGGGPRDTAEEIAQAYISRFQNPPIRVAFDLDAKQGDIWLGDVTAIVSRQKQTVTGEKRDDLNYQVIKAQESAAGHRFTYIAQSYEFFQPVDPDVVQVTIIPENTTNDLDVVSQINMRELYDATVATEASTINFVVAGGPAPSGGSVVGGGTGQTWSLRNPNDWPWSPTINLRIEPGGVIAGRGGVGGDGGNGGGTLDVNGQDGGDGQTGFLCEYATSVNNLGIIGGGGGGAGGGGGVDGSGVGGGSLNLGGGGGGGGAGKISLGGDGGVGDNNSAGGDDGAAGTFVSGGSGGSGGVDRVGIEAGDGGSGGDPGQAGSPGQAGNSGPVGAIEGTGGAGGSPGNAIDGVSFITWPTDGSGNPIKGDIRGNQV